MAIGLLNLLWSIPKLWALVWNALVLMRQSLRLKPAPKSRLADTRNNLDLAQAQA